MGMTRDMEEVVVWTVPDARSLAVGSGATGVIRELQDGASSIARLTAGGWDGVGHRGLLAVWVAPCAT